MSLLLAIVVAWLAWSRLGLDPPVVTVLAALAALAWSLFAAIFWPFVTCPAPFCHKGKVRRPGRRKAWRRCGWCAGSGARIRWARRLYDEVRPTKHRRR